MTQADDAINELSQYVHDQYEVVQVQGNERLRSLQRELDHLDNRRQNLISGVREELINLGLYENLPLLAEIEDHYPRSESYQRRLWDPAAYTAAAAASGIVGNLAYAALVALWKGRQSIGQRLFSSSDLATADPAVILEDLVCLAVVKQCAIKEVACPVRANLKVADWSNRSGRRVAHVTSRDRELEAWVEIPVNDPRLNFMVTIHALS